MTIARLKANVAAYFRQPVTSFELNGEDLILNELNAARKQAEFLNDFNLQHDVVDLVVAPAGTLMSAATKNAVAVSVKEWQRFYLIADDGTPIPINHHTKKHQANWNQQMLDNQYFANDFNARYPSQAIVNTLTQPLIRRPEVFLHGTKVVIVPASNSDVQVKVDVVLWMSDWTAASPADWFTTQGSDYLKWSAICRLNYLQKDFISGLDGNVPPPVQREREALAALVAWDANQNYAGRTPSTRYR